ncbi:GGDEF domain-containing protein [Arenimonas aestuarii]
MSTLRETLDDLATALRERPDDLLLEIGAGGELLVARLRVFVACLLLLLPLLNYGLGGQANESLAGLTGAVGVLLLSVTWLRLALRARRLAWLPMFSSCFDVTLVTGVLALLGLSGLPVATLNSTVVWSCYLLAIFATAMRHDLRVTLAAGALAMVQSALLWLVVVATADGPLVSADYGTVSTSTQLQRLVLVAVATLVTAVIVFRAQRLAQWSATDGLTGLHNRTFLNSQVPARVEAARREGQTLCLALVDLDNFRHINAELGHLAGDRALRHAVAVIRRELGREEPMIRVGGEEFVLLLPLPVGAAWERMEVLRRKLEAAPYIPEPESEPRRLTLSAGVACCPQDANDLSGLMKRADERLRAAKAGGRNRVVARDGD